MANFEYKITVILPSYKPQAYIYKCLDSLAAQTLDKTMFEVLVVLNGCNEPYYTMVKKYIDNHHECNFKVFQIDQGGVSNARNWGMSLANGEYICFIDDDDYVSAEYLKTLYMNVSSDCIPIAKLQNFYNNNESEIFDDYLTRAYNKIRGKGRIGVNDARAFMNVPVCKLVPNEICQKEHFDPNFLRGEDSLYMFALSRFFKTFVAVQPDAVYYRRIRNTSATNGETIHQMFKRYFPFVVQLFKIWIRHPLQYNFPFFISRCLAIFKTIYFRIIDKR